MRESHDICLSKIESFMKNDAPVIINRNTNVRVWEIAKFLVLASRYGYTVILVDMPLHFVLDPKVLTATNNKGLGESYITQRVRQWEEVHPFATGWAPRPRDAAKLLHRYRQLREALHEADPALAPKDIASSNVFPFCLARVCVFGRTTAESNYCSSEKVLTATNNKGLGESYITQRVRQWEEVHPFATGWAPRPRDAAKLLHRYRQLRETLHEADPALAPKDIASSNVFPFCLARVCVFGRTTAESNYCSSEKVKKAYGRHDTVRVFGYAATCGFLFAMAELTQEQASLLKKGDSGSSADKVGHEEVDDLAERMCLSLSPSNWEDVSCIVDLAKFAAPEIGGGDDGEDALRLAADKTDIKSTHPSRITIMPLRSVAGTDYSFARAVGAPWTLLATKLRSWTSPTAEEAAKKDGKVEVYAATESGREACCLLVDEETCELDVVFTGYYQPYTTPLSRNSWSTTRNFVGGRPWGRRSYDRY
ncbi:uncharacterized protein LOC142803735 isoform X2 [Rhipicephalus microplus]